MLKILNRRIIQNQEFEKSRLIDIDLLVVLNDSIKKINQILENKNWEQKRLKYSQTKKLECEITGLIKTWKNLFLESKSKEEKENIIGQILAALDYLFANVKAKRVFVRYPAINLEEFAKEKPERQLMRLMIPIEYDIRHLKSVSWWNCYNFGIWFYSNVLKEIIWNDKDIKIIFHIDNNDYHWTFSINDKFIIDSHFKQFSIKTWKEQRNTNFYKVKSDEKSDDLLSKLWVFKKFDSISDLLIYVKQLPIINASNFLIWWKDYLRISVSKKWNKLLFLLLKKVWWKIISIDIKEDNPSLENLNVDKILDFLIKKISKSEKDIELLRVIFSKLDKEILKWVFLWINNLNNLKIRTLPWFLIKILENDTIRFIIKWLYKSIRK